MSLIANFQQVWYNTPMMKSIEFLFLLALLFIFVWIFLGMIPIFDAMTAFIGTICLCGIFGICVELVKKHI